MSEKLAKRFGWWWHDPVKALRPAFPASSSEEAFRKYMWRELERAALNYELASRADGRTKYLLGNRFDRLTREQMCELAELWPRKPRPPQPLRFMLPHTEPPVATAAWRQLAVERALNQSERTRAIEMNYSVEQAGWTVPLLLTINLKRCRDRAIVEAFRKWVREQRTHLGIESPRMNKGRANKSKRGLSFRRIEALDSWTHLPRGEIVSTKYRFDDAQMRRARREAGELFTEWKQWNRGKAPAAKNSCIS
jgi:hypothetical protein